MLVTFAAREPGGSLESYEADSEIRLLSSAITCHQRCQFLDLDVKRSKKTRVPDNWRANSSNSRTLTGRLPCKLLDHAHAIQQLFAFLLQAHLISARYAHPGLRFPLAKSAHPVLSAYPICRLDKRAMRPPARNTAAKAIGGQAV